MKDPPAFGDPDRMTSPNYFASEDDGGGLHENSGVNNKAAYLMVDGDTFNGKTVTGIGIDKTELVYYEAATNLLTSASDYQDLYNALQQACANLTGTHGITSADCQQVKNALDAVEMNTPPPSAAPAEAPVCTSGTPTDLFVDNLENPASGNWSSAATLGANRWYYPQVPNPFGLETTWATSGVTNIWGADHQLRGDSSIARTASLTIPSGTTFLRFNHAYLFEHSGSSMFDGGVVEYSTNGGSTWIDAGSLFVNGGYNGALSSLTDNPLGTRQAFTGYSKGYGSSRIDLSSLAGQNVRFRFRLGLDTDGADYGWFIDDVRVYQCGSGSGTPPGAPTGVTARTGDGEATVSFSAPANPGSTPITTYTVRVSPGGTTVTTPSTVAFVYGLVNGTQYTFTVSASNAAGEGPQSTPSAPVIPSTTQGRPPGPPAPEPRPATPDPPPPVKRVPPP